MIKEKLPYKTKIKGYDNYIIDEDGNVYRKLKPRYDIGGYEYYDFCDGKGNTKRMYTHRIIAENYIKCENENKIYVNHIDGNKQNNSISNLEWVTPSENVLHSIYVLGNKPKKLSKEAKEKISLMKKGKNTGKDNFKSKSLMCIETGKIYACYRECADDIGGTPQGIYDVLHNRCKKYKGLTFKLIEDKHDSK